MEQKNQPVVSRFNPHNKLKKLLLNKISLIIAVVIVISVSITIYLTVFNNKTSSKTIADVCTLPANIHLLKSFQNYVNNSLNNTHQSLINSIMSLPNYNRDPNCLYPIVYYYINIGDANNASSYLEQLKDVYRPTVGYNPVLGQAISINTMQADISNMQKSSSEAQKSGLTLSMPTKTSGGNIK